MKTTSRQCPVCGAVVHNRKAQTCGYVCGGILQRRASELKYRLDAFDTFSAEMAYALGLLCSDGCLYRTEGSWRIAFGNTDASTVRWFHRWIRNPGKIGVERPKSKPLKAHWKVRVRRSTKSSYKSTTVSDTLGKRLLELGVRPRKSFAGMRFPSVPPEMLPHFMRGLFDGDGGIWTGRVKKMKGGKNLCVSLACAPTQMRAQIGKILSKNNMKFSESGIALQIRGTQAERFCQWIYGVGGPKMRRKYTTWAAWCRFRDKHGGLISEIGYSHGRGRATGVRPQPWHALVHTLPATAVAKRAGVSRSRVYQVMKELQRAVA